MDNLIKPKAVIVSQKKHSGNVFKIILSFAVMGIIVTMPPIAPLTDIGMDVLGVFIGTLLLLSLVDTTWPAILSIPLFAMTGVMTLNEAIAASFGNWVIMFIIMSSLLAYALNDVGFIERLLNFFLSRKFVQKSSWHFTFSLLASALINGY